MYADGPKKGKEVVVAVFVTSAPGIGPVFAGSEASLASNIAKKLPEMAKENKQKLVVLDPALVNKFKMNNPNWKLMHASEWGKKLGADFVLDIHLEKMSLYQPGSLNQLYEGQADVTADVYDVDAEPLQVNSDEPKYNYVHPFKYPRTHPVIDWMQIRIPTEPLQAGFPGTPRCRTVHEACGTQDQLWNCRRQVV